jgi:hypothetical protein
VRACKVKGRLRGERQIGTPGIGSYESRQECFHLALSAWASSSLRRGSRSVNRPHLSARGNALKASTASMRSWSTADMVVSGSPVAAACKRR